MLLERLRLRHLKNSAKLQSQTNTKSIGPGDDGLGKSANKKKREVENLEELGLTEEVMEALREMGIEVPTEIQSIGIPAVLEGKTLVLGSHTGSGKTLAYMLPLAQVPFFSIISVFGSVMLKLRLHWVFLILFIFEMRSSE